MFIFNHALSILFNVLHTKRLGEIEVNSDRLREGDVIDLQDWHLAERHFCKRCFC